MEILRFKFLCRVPEPGARGLGQPPPPPTSDERGGDRRGGGIKIADPHGEGFVFKFPHKLSKSSHAQKTFIRVG